MLKFLLRPVPHILRTGSITKNTVSGYAKAFFIKLDKERSNGSTYQHELAHVKQWWSVFTLALAAMFITLELSGVNHAAILSVIYALPIHAIMYRTSSYYRLREEARAFAASYNWYVENKGKDYADSWLAQRCQYIPRVYNLKGVKPEEVRNLILLNAN